MKQSTFPSSKQSIIRLCILSLLFISICSTIPIVNATNEQRGTFSAGMVGGLISKVSDWVNGEDGGEDKPSSTRNNLSIIEISELRVRDIKRRLARHHGYGADEIAMMLDKKELVNALAFEEHKDVQKEKDRKKRIVLRRSVIVALICVILVMFKDLFVHAFEVASVNFVVYTDKKKYEYSRCREMRSIKGLFGLFLMIILNMMQLWLSVSVLLSWVMKSKYFFPIPYLPIQPAALLASAAGTGTGGPLAGYGLNIGPMVVSGLFRFLNGRIEGFMGKALAQAMKRQKKERKKARKEEETIQTEIERKERKAARRARRAERELRKQQAEAAVEEKSDVPSAKVKEETTEVKDESLQNTRIEIETESDGGMNELD